MAAGDEVNCLYGFSKLPAQHNVAPCMNPNHVIGHLSASGHAVCYVNNINNQANKQRVVQTPSTDMAIGIS